MSGTMATSNNEWLQFYQNNLTGSPQPTSVRWTGDSVGDATAVTTTACAGASSVSNQLNRVTRPTNTRRRSRASRRTPTTLLNTDAANFRAMVQQFTGAGGVDGGGGGSPATVTSDQFLSSYSTNSSGFNYGIGSSNLVVSPPAAGSYNVEFRPPYHRKYYRTAADNGGGCGDCPSGFVERLQDGGMGSFKAANFSGENVNGGMNTTSMF